MKMNLYADTDNNILINQAWEDFQEELAYMEDQILANYLNKANNRKGYTLADYHNSDNYLY